MATTQESIAALQAQPEYARLAEMVRQTITSLGGNRVSFQITGDWLFKIDYADTRALYGTRISGATPEADLVWLKFVDFVDLEADLGQPFILGEIQTSPSNSKGLLPLLLKSNEHSVVFRELNLELGQIQRDGFSSQVPSYHNDYFWAGENDIVLSTNHGATPEEIAENSTQYGYPRNVRKWSRGQTLENSAVVFQVPKSEGSVTVHQVDLEGTTSVLVETWHDFHRKTMTLIDLDGSNSFQLPIPQGISHAIHIGGQFLFSIRESWQNHPAGSLVSFDLAEARKTGVIASSKSLFAPTASSFLDWMAVSATRDSAHFTAISNMNKVLLKAKWTGRAWEVATIRQAPGQNFTVVTNNFNNLFPDRHATGVLIRTEGVVNPGQLSLLRQDGVVIPMPNQSQFVNDVPVEVSVRWGRSADGTPVPYTLVRPTQVTGPSPTLLSAYGVYGIPQLSSFSPSMYGAWLKQGVPLVFGHIRGGGEQGPAWHSGGQRLNRPRSFEDVHAIAEDLLATGVSLPGKIGLRGASAGGLIVATAALQRPDLYGAVLMQVPLVDPLVDRNGVDEFGDPDIPSERAIMETFLPMNLAATRTGQDAPAFLIQAAVQDARINIGAVRSFVALLQSRGIPVQYLEWSEGGHVNEGRSGDIIELETSLYAQFLCERLMR